MITHAYFFRGSPSGTRRDLSYIGVGFPVGEIPLFREGLGVNKYTVDVVIREGIFDIQVGDIITFRLNNKSYAYHIDKLEVKEQTTNLYSLTIIEPHKFYMEVSQDDADTITTYHGEWNDFGRYLYEEYRRENEYYNMNFTVDFVTMFGRLPKQKFRFAYEEEFYVDHDKSDNPNLVTFDLTKDKLADTLARWNFSPTSNTQKIHLTDLPAMVGTPMEKEPRLELSYNVASNYEGFFNPLGDLGQSIVLKANTRYKYTFNFLGQVGKFLNIAVRVWAYNDDGSGRVHYDWFPNMGTAGQVGSVDYRFKTDNRKRYEIRVYIRHVNNSAIPRLFWISDVSLTEDRDEPFYGYSQPLTQIYDTLFNVNNTSMYVNFEKTLTTEKPTLEVLSKVSKESTAKTINLNTLPVTSYTKSDLNFTGTNLLIRYQDLETRLVLGGDGRVYEAPLPPNVQPLINTLPVYINLKDSEEFSVVVEEEREKLKALFYNHEIVVKLTSRETFNTWETQVGDFFTLYEHNKPIKSKLTSVYYSEQKGLILTFGISRVDAIIMLRDLIGGMK